MPNFTGILTRISRNPEFLSENLQECFMMKFFSSCLLLGTIPWLFCSCDRFTQSPISLTSLFKGTPTEKAVKPLIEEASGIADSKANPGNLWVQEDSGRPAQLFLLGHDGKVLKKIALKGIVNRDWEDIALVSNELFVGDIGDNNQAYPEYFIYQFTEPASITDTVSTIKQIRFRYPDGSHDVEAFVVDPQTKDIYLLTKQDNPAKLYKIAYPYDYNALNQAAFVGNVKYTGLVSASISADGQEILLKTYTSLYYYRRNSNEAMADALQQNFTNIPYNLEPQGEAVTFAADNSGFFTLSEKGLATAVNLYFYERNK